MKICISAESTIDLPQEILDKYDIHTTPFGINFADKFVQDRFGISSEIFEFVDKTKKLPKTSAVPPEQFKEHFDKLLETYDAVIHFSISATMSGAYNNAVSVSENMDNVYIVDSKSLSTGIALLAIRARELADKGLDASDIYNEILNTVPKVQAGFVVEKLNYLYKGGRCSALALLGSNVLNIKPQIKVANGRMGVEKKYVGNINKVVAKYVEDVLADHPNPNLDYVFITHSSPMPQAQEMLKIRLQERGFKTIYDTLAGGTVSSHCGPNTIGVLFIDE